MTTTEYGTLRPEETDDRCAVRFERLYDATPEEMWAALTDPEELPGWLADASRLQLTVGGEVHLDFGGGEEMHGEILALEPGRLLEYSWRYTGERDSVVRFEIVPREHGVLLVLDHRLLGNEVAVEYGAGWHAHLDLLAGAASDFRSRYEELRPEYEEATAALR